jgi:tetratricopeptide (TPR) repeat protein
MSEESQPEELLRQGIAAAKAGRKEEAHETLLQVVKLDERNEQAWLWLSAVVDSDEEKQICLENVLAVNPANPHAQAGLEWLRSSRPEPTAEPEPALEPEAEYGPEPEAAFGPEPEAEYGPEPEAEYGPEPEAEYGPEPEAEYGPEPEEAEAAGRELCPRCGGAVRPSSSACTSCGLPLIILCPACGEYAGIEQASCPHCGQGLGDFRDGPAYHTRLARLYLQNHVAERAEEALERAEVEAEGDADALAEVGSMYEEGGMRGKAMAAYKRAIEAAPRDPDLHARLAGVYRRYNERAKAEAMYQKAEELGSQDPAVMYELARLELEAGAAQKAVTRLQPLLRRQPVEPRAVLLMGDALQSLGNEDAAVAHYRRALQLAPGDTDARREAQGKLAQLGATPGKPDRVVAPGQRPGCVTLYALLAIASGLIGVLAVLVLAAVYAGGGAAMQETLAQAGLGGTVDLEGLAPYAAPGLILALLWVVIGLGTGVGLLLRRNWARVVVILLSIVAFAAVLVQVAMSSGLLGEGAGGLDLTSLPPAVIGGLLAALAIQALVIFWFVANREAFD